MSGDACMGHKNTLDKLKVPVFNNFYRFWKKISFPPHPPPPPLVFTFGRFDAPYFHNNDFRNIVANLYFIYS